MYACMYIHIQTSYWFGGWVTLLENTRESPRCSSVRHGAALARDGVPIGASAASGNILPITLGE